MSRRKIHQAAKLREVTSSNLDPTGTPHIAIEVSRGFPQSNHANAGIALKIRPHIRVTADDGGRAVKGMSCLSLLARTL
jgi:hypothetical protein